MRAFLDELTELERRRITCQPIPARWAGLEARSDLDWRRFPFNRTAMGEIPTDPGFFCFFIGPPPESLPPVGFPIYFGRTEHRNLRFRFAQYIQEQGDPDIRPQVRDFLEVFEGELFFLCARFTGSPEEMTSTARQILDALRPAFSDPAYEAEAQPGQGAW